MKNGFFHDRPNDHDIYVVEALRGEFAGAASINWRVQNSRVEGGELVADVEYNGKTYKAVRQERGADHYWEIYAVYEDYTVTYKNNPQALPFVSQHWRVIASSEQEAVEQVVKHSPLPLQDGVRQELIAFKGWQEPAC